MGLSKWEEDLLKNADAVIDKSPMEDLYAGVFFNQNRKKYWIDKATFGNCFMVFARDFSVEWGSDKRYWDWPSIKETSDVFIDVVELLQVSRLSVESKFDTANLTAGMNYEVVFVMMLKEDSDGWSAPVTFRLDLPNGNKQEHEESLLKKPRSQWFEIQVGEFMVEPKNDGIIKFMLGETNSGGWKRGLVVKGVVIRPKK
ncbi:protein PHLOEM PROTEIN 2-LIKE A1-like isoform X1 [Lactuca sativa]|uniref:protein PHLOEM PROTEIN 2-LIKE A1-like isoform X1 n=1 Tax=Lactuca sativa TaxID=4236 RepID=UPI000CD81EBB|nr:protein PHLOEM PROTEIN 2-LIKE A1-like isoform X1 [Lactuca sativa]